MNVSKKVVMITGIVIAAALVIAGSYYLTQSPAAEPETKETAVVEPAKVEAPASWWPSMPSMPSFSWFSASKKADATAETKETETKTEKPSA